ncbi:isoprenoid synthase domain-containing protein [Mycena crocata]|nr:isoprenoid synthase domain-containing protein [Mycena crocata]
MMSAASSTEALAKAMDAKIRAWNVDLPSEAVLKSLTNKAVTVSEYFYYNNTFEEKLAFAFYAWFFFYTDDMVPQSHLEGFLRGIMVGGGQPEVTGPLSKFQFILTDLYEHWDPIAASLMITSAMEFINKTALEGREEVARIQVHPSAASWPRFLRAKTGMAPGFSCAAFPRSSHPDLSTYVQALPDIDEYLAFVNDILSFYKEDLAGETMNYVSVRARVTRRHPKRVLVEMVEEVGVLHRRIAAVLADHPKALSAWLTLQHGFLAWHLGLDRYKLAADFGFVW